MPRDWRLTGNEDWKEVRTVESEAYRCGYCSLDVASNRGWETGSRSATIRICPNCNGTTLFAASGAQWPGPQPGGHVAHLLEDVEKVYSEARSALSVRAFTGSVMLCRKILMNVAVTKGAEKDKTFKFYVQWLVQEGYSPRGSEGWLAYMLEKGNEANHEIVPMEQNDAQSVLKFTEQLLRNAFELPALVPKKPA